MLDHADIGVRLSSCLGVHTASDNEDTKKTDPFCLYRIMIAQYVDNLNYRCNDLTTEVSHTLFDTHEHLGNPYELKDRTLAIFAQGSHLRWLMNSISCIEYSLKEISEARALLFEKLGLACTSSQVASANDDLAFLCSAVDGMRKQISYLDDMKDDMLTLVRWLANMDSQRIFFC